MNNFVNSTFIHQKVAYAYLAQLIENNLLDLYNLKKMNKLVGDKVEKLLVGEDDITFKVLIDENSLTPFLTQLIKTGRLNYLQLKDYDKEKAEEIFPLLRGSFIPVNCYKCGALYKTSRFYDVCPSCKKREK